MADCFLISRALDGTLTRLEPMDNRLARTPGLGEMMGDNLRQGFGQRRKPLDRYCGDTRMQRLGEDFLLTGLVRK